MTVAEVVIATFILLLGIMATFQLFGRHPQHVQS